LATLFRLLLGRVGWRLTLLRFLFLNRLTFGI
jgi:hypothetical protein